MELTDDSGLYLLTNTGEAIYKTHQIDKKSIFLLPKNTQSIHIVSKTARPSEVIGPFVDDRRHLGLLISDIHLFNSQTTIEIDIHLTDHTLDGWDVMEETPCRWTNGHAHLPLEDELDGSMQYLSLTIEAGGPYLAC